MRKAGIGEHFAFCLLTTTIFIPGLSTTSSLSDPVVTSFPALAALEAGNRAPQAAHLKYVCLVAASNDCQVHLKSRCGHTCVRGCAIVSKKDFISSLIASLYPSLRTQFISADVSCTTRPDWQAQEWAPGVFGNTGFRHLKICPLYLVPYRSNPRRAHPPVNLKITRMTEPGLYDREDRHRP